ncbi:MAG: alpha-1,6-mannosyltransferase [Trizodia sp. TS-e1964]|nr:MAG: alpha-1,6-mannosyltransferase [Trizodia sp. TS-e1964]
MSLSRSPSPRPGVGFASPGLTPHYSGQSGRSSPTVTYAQLKAGSNNVDWASTKSRSDRVKSPSSFASQTNSFVGRHLRSLSNSLPHFNLGIGPGEFAAEKGYPGRVQWAPDHGNTPGQLRAYLGRILRRMRFRVLLLVAIFFAITLFYITPLHQIYRRSAIFGGGKKFVIIVASNQGGGVMEWKGPREWAIERDSVKNKRKYAQKWGYELEVVDMSTKKRYAHEWRESWEKVDTIRNCLKKYPDAEWFWWLDLHTFIMEPSYSLQSHLFDRLGTSVYRDINDYNPLNISHPFTSHYLDSVSLSPIGDGKPSSINLVIPQDCGGFNLGSFFIKRSAWTERLLDIWWDPVSYEQKHMEWEHKEQDALEYLYTNQPWIRSNTAFIAQRKINSFPLGACGEKGEDPRIHYREKDRDFVVNMAGCEWGRDCWGEMYNYRELSNKLNRPLWQKMRDSIVGRLRSLKKQKEDKKAT